MALSRAARHAGVIDSSGTNGGAPSTQLNIIGRVERDGRKTNREAHVGQMDEGRSAGAVCRRDKSTLGARGGREAEEPGVEPSVTNTHTGQLRRGDVSIPWLQVFARDTTDLNLCPVTEQPDTPGWDVSQSRWTYFTCSAGKELIENSRRGGLDKPCADLNACQVASLKNPPFQVFFPHVFV